VETHKVAPKVGLFLAFRINNTFISCVFCLLASELNGVRLAIIKTSGINFITDVEQGQGCPPPTPARPPSSRIYNKHQSCVPNINSNTERRREWQSENISDYSRIKAFLSRRSNWRMLELGSAQHSRAESIRFQ
jgi:hypothetical protein